MWSRFGASPPCYKPPSFWSLSLDVCPSVLLTKHLTVPRTARDVGHQSTKRAVPALPDAGHLGLSRGHPEYELLIDEVVAAAEEAGIAACRTAALRCAAPSGLASPASRLGRGGKHSPRPRQPTTDNRRPHRLLGRRRCALQNREDHSFVGQGGQRDFSAGVQISAGFTEADFG